jgi:hypothetical protein
MEGFRRHEFDMLPHLFPANQSATDTIDARTSINNTLDSVVHQLDTGLVSGVLSQGTWRRLLLDYGSWTYDWVHRRLGIHSLLIGEMKLGKHFLSADMLRLTHESIDLICLLVIRDFRQTRRP